MGERKQYYEVTTEASFSFKYIPTSKMLNYLKNKSLLFIRRLDIILTKFVQVNLYKVSNYITRKNIDYK